MIVFSLCILFGASSQAQTPPSSNEVEQFSPFHQAVYQGNIEDVISHIQNTNNLEQRDMFGRTAVHIATYQSEKEILEYLVKAGADVNAFENDQYDAVTIAAVANDLETLRTVLKLGGDPKNTTSPYDGTSLIAAAHLGHVDVVKALLIAGSNVDHINNLGWTALLEAIILGDGGSHHTSIVRDLLNHGADKSIADRRGTTPLMHARQYNYREMIELLE